MFVINIISSSNKVNNSHKSVFTQSETGSCQIYQGGQRPSIVYYAEAAKHKSTKSKHNQTQIKT